MTQDKTSRGTVSAASDPNPVSNRPAEHDPGTTPDPAKSPPRNPGGIASGLQPGGTVPGKTPAAGTGAIGTGGGSTGGNATGTVKRTL